MLHHSKQILPSSNCQTDFCSHRLIKYPKKCWSKANTMYFLKLSCSSCNNFPLFDSNQYQRKKLRPQNTSEYCSDHPHSDKEQQENHRDILPMDRHCELFFCKEGFDKKQLWLIAVQ